MFLKPSVANNNEGLNIVIFGELTPTPIPRERKVHNYRVSPITSQLFWFSSVA